jgi:hypothetical protein
LRQFLLQIHDDKEDNGNLSVFCFLLFSFFRRFAP